MSLENLREKVLEKARAKAEKIINDAKEQASKIVNEAKKEYLRKSEEVRNRELMELINEYSHKLTMKSMELNIELLKVKNQIIEDLMESVKMRLKEVSEDLRKKSLTKLLNEALTEGININEVVVKVLPKDVDLLRKVLNEESNKALVIKKIDVLPEFYLGGVIVESVDGTFALDNTYLTRLEKLSTILYKRLTEEVFKW